MCAPGRAGLERWQGGAGWGSGVVAQGGGSLATGLVG
jgi:hypothetical protein